MDETGKSDREINPRQNANILSKITFAFAWPMFRKGMRKEFDESDIYEPMKICRATALGNRLEKEWEKEKQRDSPRFLVSLIKVFGMEYMILGLVVLVIHTSLMMAKPLLKGKIVSYFSPNQTELSQSDALYYAATLLGCTYVNTIFNHSYVFALEQLTLKIKIAICALIYRKTLKLSSVYMSKVASGQAVTLITKDINSFDLAIFLAHKLWIGIIQILIMMYIMYRQIGVSALVGTAALFVFIPIQAFLGKKAASYRTKTAEKTDQRVRITQEILTAIRIIKMYTWELFFTKSVSTVRKEEIRNLRILFYIKTVILSIGQLNARFALYICVITYISLGNHINAEKAFVVTGCFMTLRVVITIFIPLSIAQLSELGAIVKRITNFLLLEEVDGNQNIDIIEDKQEPKIFIKGATVKLDHDVEILEDINLTIKPGLTLLTGPVGSGKSTLLKLILGDVNKADGEVDVTGRMSYAAQEPWLFPGTAKQNILFGESFDQERYETVIKVCALKKDFADLPEGDRTSLIDHGLNLSRGQKTRINLARCVYRSADIYLLDDCLSAVDPHVGKHIFYECVKGFLKDKMCVLVTHQEQLWQEANNIVILSSGCVRLQGSYENLKEWDNEEFKSIVNKEKEYVGFELFEKAEIADAENELESVDESSKLLTDLTMPKKNIYQETMETGSVKKEVYKTYFTSGGGVKMILLVIVLSLVAQAISSWSDYFVSFWVDMEQDLSGFRFNQTTNSTEFKKLEASHKSIMTQYSFVILGAAILTVLRAFAFFIFSSKASTNIHNLILDKILNAGMAFFDDNLSGNIINRFSRDLGIIDEQLPYVLFELSRVTLMLFGILFVVSSVNTMFLIPSAAFIVLLYFARRLYIPTGRSIRRLEGATRSPVVGQFNATLEGLTTIRASQAQPILNKEFEKHLDLYNSTVYMHLSTSRAFGFYLDAMCDLYVSLITVSFLLFKTNTLAGRVGLAITQSFSLTGLLQWGVRQWAELENHMTSAERVLEYTKVEPEDKSGDMIINWPHSGKIVYTDVNLRYLSTNERVLKDVNFIIHPKQKIGVVGRTGAGKTSIISTLFRLYEFRGNISIDGIDINSLTVELLRSKISIIPQDPVLFTGTIRSNIDPNSEYPDKDIWDALTEVELKPLIESLDAHISEGGSNFSVGQRQLICLARAIVRNNIILVLDEATANIDPQTDALIQKTIRNKFSGCTVITIAHRLNTILDSDRVLVMDSGCVIEYEHPNVLLANKDSIFYKMVNEAGLV